jgi:hypothetical protein
VLFKIIIIFLCVVYLLRLLSPFLFKLLFSSLVKKAATQREPQQPQSNPKQNKTSSDSIGEYIDYEEVE